MLIAAILTCLVLLIPPSHQELPDGVHCPKYTIEEGGTFESPEYSVSKAVINGFHCWYNFKTGKNKRVVLEFLDFSLHEPMYTEKLNFDKYEVGCEREFIEVYRDSKKLKEKERYCGTELKGRTLTSTSNEMKFVLNKYYNDTKGFKIKLRFVKKDNLEIDACKEMYAKEGDIATSESTEDCRITAKAPVGQGATLTFTKITPRPRGENCKRSKIQKKTAVKVRGGHFPVCGADIMEKSFKALTNVLDLQVDVQSSKINAKITFNPLPTTCGGEVKLETDSSRKIKLPNHIDTPVHNQLSCAWTVNIPGDAKGVKISYPNFDLAPKTGSSCETDQFSVVEFKEDKIADFLERRSKETPKLSCASDFDGVTQEFTGGKTIYLFLSMDFSVDHQRQFTAELTLI